MLVQSGFNVNVGRILNPTAVFCNNRNDYYTYLSSADSGTAKGMLAWCSYVLKGLKEEIEKIDRLLDYKVLTEDILIPAINASIERRYITETEAKVLRKAAEMQVIQAGDIKDIFPGKASAEVSRQLRRLIQKKMPISSRKVQAVRYAFLTPPACYAASYKCWEKRTSFHRKNNLVFS